MYRFDDSRRPLYITRLSGRLERGDIAVMERDIMTMLEARATYGSLWDLTELEFPAREVISAAMKMSSRTTPVSRELYEIPPDAPPVCVSYVVGPRLAKLIHFFYRVPARSMVTPAGFFTSFELALEATERKLESFGVVVPPRRT